MAFRIRVRHQLSGGRRRHGRHSSARSGACAAPVTWERSGECEERGGGRERERERTERQREKIERERGRGGGVLAKNETYAGSPRRLMGNTEILPTVWVHTTTIHLFTRARIPACRRETPRGGHDDPPRQPPSHRHTPPPGACLTARYKLKITDQKNSLSLNTNMLYSGLLA